MKDLTSRQREILELIKSHLKEKGFPPTRADISRTLGFKSHNAAEQHLRAIEKKGFISILAGASRGIVLNEEEKGIPVRRERETCYWISGCWWAYTSSRKY